MSGCVVFKVFYDNGRRGYDIVRKLKMEVLHVYYGFQIRALDREFTHTKKAVEGY